MKKIASIFAITTILIPLTANAECVPSPDCASIGYTETSCDGDSLKCPFDTTKLKCIPCDSSFRYSCEGENIKNSIGDACNNKYVACECEDRTIFINGECVCDTSCDIIGNIYYSDGTCSSCNLTDKTPVGVIAHKDEEHITIINLERVIMPWSTDQLDDNGNVVVSQGIDLPNLNNYNNAEDAKNDINGYYNTQEIVNSFGKNANGVAAVYCHNYTPIGLESSKGQWYLPAFGELYDIGINNYANITKTFNILSKSYNGNGFFWSSTEMHTGWAWLVNQNATSMPNNPKKMDLLLCACYL